MLLWRQTYMTVIATQADLNKTYHQPGFLSVLEVNLLYLFILWLLVARSLRRTNTTRTVQYATPWFFVRVLFMVKLAVPSRLTLRCSAPRGRSVMFPQ